MQENYWLALAIGNSRLHWACFEKEILKDVWDSEHRSNNLVKGQLPKEILPASLLKLSLQDIPLYLASVVPQQTSFWQSYPNTIEIDLFDIPLEGIYPTMGIDRALALYGAIKNYGCPCLVVDAGTALTFTGANERGQLVGGAILPGLKLQLKSLASQTAALPEVKLSTKLPQRWAKETSEAIESGIIYATIAGIQDFISQWLQKLPLSKVILTGGDANLLLTYLQARDLVIARKISIDRNLIFWGMRGLVT
jgi:type III pantothenate kinase